MIQNQNQNIQKESFRWIILTLFSIATFLNGAMWISFASTSLICSKFFGVSLFWINALSMIYMVVFFAFPIATTIIDRYGLETAARVGVVLNVLGAILRCVGCSHSSLFVVVFVGQTVCGFGQIFMLGVPACLAQTWFPDNEKARATSIAALTNQLGVAAGFLAPVIVTTGDQLLRLQIVFVCLCVASAVATFVWFRAPQFAASISQQIKNTANTAQAEQSNVAAFLRDLRALCSNVQFMLLALLFGCATGLFYAFTTLLDDILHHYVGDEVSAGAVGLCIVAVGLIGAMAAGVLMDRLPHSHVTLCRAASLLYLVAFVWWHAAVVNVWPRVHLFASTIAQGVSVTALLPICFEIGVEMTFPLSESNSASVQLAIAQLFGIVLIVIDSMFNEHNNYTATLSIFDALAGTCVLLSFIVRMTYNRENVAGALLHT